MPDLKDVDIAEMNDSVNYDHEDISAWTKDPVEGQLPKDMVFPEELNKFLRERIRDLTTENGCLRRTLEEMEEKVQTLTKQISNSQNLMSLGKSSEVAATKIVELSKKCRELTAECEALKTKCKNLETSLLNKEAELENLKRDAHSRTTFPENSSDSAVDSQSSIKEAEEKVKSLTEKLHQTQTKLYETKNTCSGLKQELHKAQKLLCSEIGENVPIATLSNQPGGWRGRAEQIRLLQQRVAELQAKIADYEGTSKGPSVISSSVSLERKNLANLRNIEKERRQQIENSAKELRQAEVSLETYKRKLEASKARIKVLENELNTTKANLAVLNEKRSHDDRLIEVLNNRLKTNEVKFQEKENEIKNKEEKVERECANLKNELQSAHIQINRLRRRLEEREIEIDKLRDGILPEEPLKLQRTFHHDDFQKRNCHVSPPNTERSSIEPNEYVTLALAAEAERERLLELVTVLNRRLDKERNEAEAIAANLRNERNRSAKLETKLRKLESERVGISKIDTGYRSKFFAKNLSTRTNEIPMDNEQTRYKLELLEEECLALKARLDTVQQDKATDLAMYRRMLDEARKTFQDACRNKPPSGAGNRSTMTL